MASEQLDIASALDLTMSDEQESKFMALKALHAKKIKHLMVSIDAKEKEVAKLKVLSKDSRRTQMIQALRGKIKDMEVIQDTIKEEFCKKAKMELEDVNDFIIRKTIGGPKRFRPLSREEMENKIIDCERKMARMAAKGGVDGGKSIASQAKSITTAANALTSIANRTDKVQVKDKTAGGGAGAATLSKPAGGDGLAKVAQLMEEINGLRNALDVAQGAVELQKEEVTRLRQRNSDMAADDEEVKFLNAQFKEAVTGRAHAEEQQALLVQKLAAVEEEVALLKSGNSLELEHGNLQLDALQMHCEKLLKQNSSLLHRLADMETELDAAHEHSAGAASAGKAAVTSSEATQGVVRDMEKKISRLADKLKMSEQLISELQADNAQISALREQLRAKNIAIKELTKHVDALGGTVGLSPSTSPSRAPNAAAGVSVGDASIVKELKEENIRLKQALRFAQSGGGGGMGGSVDTVDMMKMKLVSANEEAESLHKQVEKLTLQLQEKKAGGSPRNSPQKNSPRRESTGELGQARR